MWQEEYTQVRGNAQLHNCLSCPCLTKASTSCNNISTLCQALPLLPLCVQVVAGFDQLQGLGCSVQVYKDVGLAVLRCPEPLHYYSLFSHTCGCDYVLTMYDHHR